MKHSTVNLIIRILPLLVLAFGSGRFEPMAAQGAYYQNVTVTKLYAPSPSTFNIPFNMASNVYFWSFPAITPDPNKVVVLKFRTRYPSGGWNNILSAQLNNQTLTSTNPTGVYRLLDRVDKDGAASTIGTYPYFTAYNGKVCLLVLFSSSWTTVDTRFNPSPDKAELYTYLLNVSDLVSSSQTNNLTLINNGNTASNTPYPDSNYLIIDNLTVGTISRSDYNQMIYDPYSAMGQFTPVSTISQNGNTLEIAAQGGVRLSRNGERYCWCSEFTEPNATHIRYNDLSWVTRGTDLYPGTGTVQITSQGGSSILVRLAGSYYTLNRTLTLDGSFVRVTDNYTNPTASAVGLVMENDFYPEQAAQRWYVDGKRELSYETGWATASNPSVYLMRANSGLGAAVKDTVIRQRLENSGSLNAVTMKHQHFGLAAGASYVAQWQIYLGPSGYFNFINAVRNDWNVNYTIPGLWSFWDFTRSDLQAGYLNNPDALTTCLNRYKIDIFSLCPWFEYYYAPSYWQPRSTYKALIQYHMNSIKQAKPAAKCTANLESFLYYAPLSLFNGYVSPLSVGTRGDFDSVISSQATAAINATPWNDSILRDSSGMGIIDRYYSYAYNETACNLQVFPTDTNYWQTKFLDILDFTLNECGLDGVYIDSFSQFLMNEWKFYDRWDNHSVDINSQTGQITQQYAFGGLLTNTARASWIHYCLDRGKLVFTNGYSDSAEIQSLPKIGFCEAEGSFSYNNPSFHNGETAANGQLSSPLALGVRIANYPGADAGKLYQQAVISYLRQGILYCHYNTELPDYGQSGYGECGAINYMFPITPVELGEGYVIGQERIVTCISKTFHWPSATAPVCKMFDQSGLEIAGGFTVQPSSGGGWDVQVQLTDWQQTAVIMRPDVNLKGTISLGGYTGDVTMVGIKVQLLSGGTAVATYKTVLDDNATFSISQAPTGTYDVAVKCPYSLRKVIPGVPITSTGLTDLGTITLFNGDCDSNNAIDSSDLAIVLTNMDTLGI